MTNPVEPTDPPKTGEVDPPKVDPTPDPPKPPEPINPPPTNPSNADMSAFFKSVTDAVAAIPERIVDAMREANPKPDPVTPPVNPGTEGVTTPPPGEKVKGRSFADKWFGK